MSLPLSFPSGQIESLAKILGDSASGSEITSFLSELGLDDNSQGSTKWRRLNFVFCKIQESDRSTNRILRYIQIALSPARFIGQNEQFEEHRGQINAVLSFSGIEYGADGEFRKVKPARTLSEAELRANTIKAKFQGRRIHPEVLKYCGPELMADNYFHAVFEATKGLAQRIRDLSGDDGDGAALVDKTFSVKNPVLAFNSLRTETERSEHKGFVTLLKGCFAAIRNPLAHEPKILWDGEDDAADYFTLISLLHRKLDDCIVTRL